MRKSVNKRGSAHFEMIVSFVFFIGFVFFLFVVLSPADNSTLPDSVIMALHNSFEENVSTNLSSFFLKVDLEDGYTCFEIKLEKEIFDYKIDDRDSHVATLGGNDVDSGFTESSGKLVIDSVETSYRVSFSPEFNDEGKDGAGCNNLNKRYEIGEIIEQKVVSYKALEAMKINYDGDDYDDLREKLKIPPMFDFAITFETLNEVDMEPGNIPNSIDVLAEDYMFVILKEDSSLINEKVTFRIW